MDVFGGEVNFAVASSLEVLIPNVPYPYSMIMSTYLSDRTTIIASVAVTVNSSSDFPDSVDLSGGAISEGDTGIFYGTLGIESEICGRVCLGFTFQVENFGTSFLETTTNVYNGTCDEAIPAPPPLGTTCCTEFQDAVIDMFVTTQAQTPSVPSGGTVDLTVFLPTATTCNYAAALTMQHFVDGGGITCVQSATFNAVGGGGYYTGNGVWNSGFVPLVLAITYTITLPDGLVFTSVGARWNTPELLEVFIYVTLVNLDCNTTRVMKYVGNMKDAAPSGATFAYIADVPTLPACQIV
jgi:hypothetical protein